MNEPIGRFIKKLVYRGLESIGRYYSSYIGIVLDNEDQDNMHRIQFKAPAVSGSFTHPVWAKPKMFSGDGYGIHLLPQVKDKVWIEFEGGDTRYPIWSFGPQVSGHNPEEFDSPQKFGFKSPAGHLILINEVDNLIQVQHKDGLVITIDSDAIKLNGDENYGLVLIRPLVDKINFLERKVITIENNLVGHIHIDPLSGSTAVQTPVYRDNIINVVETTEQSELENENVKH